MEHEQHSTMNTSQSPLLSYASSASSSGGGALPDSIPVMQSNAEALRRLVSDQEVDKKKHGMQYGVLTIVYNDVRFGAQGAILSSSRTERDVAIYCAETHVDLQDPTWIERTFGLNWRERILAHEAALKAYTEKPVAGYPRTEYDADAGQYRRVMKLAHPSIEPQSCLIITGPRYRPRMLCENKLCATTGGNVVLARNGFSYSCTLCGSVAREERMEEQAPRVFDEERASQVASAVRFRRDNAAKDSYRQSEALLAKYSNLFSGKIDAYFRSCVDVVARSWLSDKNRCRESVAVDASLSHSASASASSVSHSALCLPKCIEEAVSIFTRFASERLAPIGGGGDSASAPIDRAPRVTTAHLQALVFSTIYAIKARFKEVMLVDFANKTYVFGSEFSKESKKSAKLRLSDTRVLTRQYRDFLLRAGLEGDTFAIEIQGWVYKFMEMLGYSDAVNSDTLIHHTRVMHYWRLVYARMQQCITDMQASHAGDLHDVLITRIFNFQPRVIAAAVIYRAVGDDASSGIVVHTWPIAIRNIIAEFLSSGSQFHIPMHIRLKFERRRDCILTRMKAAQWAPMRDECIDACYGEWYNEWQKKTRELSAAMKVKKEEVKVEKQEEEIKVENEEDATPKVKQEVDEQVATNEEFEAALQEAFEKLDGSDASVKEEPVDDDAGDESDSDYNWNDDAAVSDHHGVNPLDVPVAPAAPFISKTELKSYQRVNRLWIYAAGALRRDELVQRDKAAKKSAVAAKLADEYYAYRRMDSAERQGMVYPPRVKFSRDWFYLLADVSRSRIQNVLKCMPPMPLHVQVAPASAPLPRTPSPAERPMLSPYQRMIKKRKSPARSDTDIIRGGMRSRRKKRSDSASDDEEDGDGGMLQLTPLPVEASLPLAPAFPAIVLSRDQLDEMEYARLRSSDEHKPLSEMNPFPSIN